MELHTLDKFDFFRSSEDNHCSSEVIFVGKYRDIRSQLDYSYHKHYKAERQLFHDRLIDQFLGTIVRDHGGNVTCEVPTENWIVFTAGPMGAGKGHTIQWLFKNNLFPLDAFVNVDPDEIRSMLPEIDKYNEIDTNTAGILTQKEVGYISEVLSYDALQKGKNVLIDGSLRNAMWYLEYFRNLRDKFPTIKIAILQITAKPETVLLRAKKRALVTGRVVPEEVILASMESIPKSLAVLSPKANFVAIFSNEDNEPEPRLTYCCMRGKCSSNADNSNNNHDTMINSIYSIASTKMISNVSAVSTVAADITSKYSNNHVTDNNHIMNNNNSGGGDDDADVENRTVYLNSNISGNVTDSNNKNEPCTVSKNNNHSIVNDGSNIGINISSIASSKEDLDILWSLKENNSSAAYSDSANNYNNNTGQCFHSDYVCRHTCNSNIDNYGIVAKPSTIICSDINANNIISATTTMISTSVATLSATTSTITTTTTTTVNSTICPLYLLIDSNSGANSNSLNNDNTNSSSDGKDSSENINNIATTATITLHTKEKDMSINSNHNTFDHHQRYNTIPDAARKYYLFFVHTHVHHTHLQQSQLQGDKQESYVDYEVGGSRVLSSWKHVFKEVWHMKCKI